jgi:hypothetical protein
MRALPEDDELLLAGFDFFTVALLLRALLLRLAFLAAFASFGALAIESKESLRCLSPKMFCSKAFN